jgi:hypothetical protein
MTDEQKRLLQKLELPEAERTAISAEIKSVADQIARLEAVRQRATDEQPLGPVVGEWIETPREDGPPQIVRGPPAR